MSAPIHPTLHDPMQPATLPAGLYLVSTPIGNLRDITLRAIDVLGGVESVLCEDTRVSGKLLSHLGIKTKLFVYNDHTDDATRQNIIDRLQNGASMALISDAGTPLLSDPGYKLVQAAMAAGIKIVPVPGPSALLPALQLGALPTDKFMFAGFLPAKTKARKDILEALKAVPATLVFYESATRLPESVRDAYAVLGDRPVALAREITKMYETALHGTLAAWAADASLMGTLKGECVLMLGAPVAKPITADDARAALASALQDMSVRDAATVVSETTGLPRKTLYDLALEIRNAKS